MVRAFHLAALVSICALSACSARRAPQLARPSTLAEAVAVSVTHQPGAEGWAVAYRFPSPVLSAAFERPSSPLREKWRVISPQGVQIFRTRGGDTVASRTGESFDTLVLAVPELTGETEEEENPLVVRYSDGGRLLDTGALVLAPCPFEGCDAPRDSPPPPALFHLEPRPGERVVTAEKIAEGHPEWGPVPDGTYVYFGRTRPLETEAVVAVVDAGLPAWIDEEVDRALPLLFDHYAEQTGIRLPFRPIVFLSYGDAAGGQDMELSGKSLPRGVRLDVRLGAEHRAGPSPAALEGVLDLVAQEAARLWNAPPFRHRDLEGRRSTGP